MTRKDLFLQYFLNQIDIRQQVVERFNRGFLRKPDELDAVDYIVALTELKCYEQVFNDLRAIMKITKE